MDYKIGIWRWLTNFWTIVLYAAIIYDFVYNNAIISLIGPMSAIYVATLAVYTGNKEFERWSEDHNSRHPGEVFVIVWTIIIFFLFTASFMLNRTYKMPESIISTYIVVLGVLAITERSKLAFKESKTTRSNRSRISSKK